LPVFSSAITNFPFFFGCFSNSPSHHSMQQQILNFFFWRFKNLFSRLPRQL